MADVSLVRRWAVFGAGLASLSCGIAAGVSAGAGLATWDLLAVALAGLSGVSVGAAVTVAGLVAAAVAWPVGFRPDVGTAVVLVAFGPAVDGWLAVWAPAAGAPWLLAVAAVGIGVGVALYVQADVGVGPHDGPVAALLAAGWPLGRSKAAVDVVVTSAGWVLGGPVGLGTAVLAVVPALVAGRVGPAARRLAAGPDARVGVDTVA